MKGGAYPQKYFQVFYSFFTTNQTKESKGDLQMNKAIFKKICLLSALSITIISFIACYGEEECTFRVEVSPYQVNIDSGGTAHYVRVLTYTWYKNTAEAYVYINPPDGNEELIDPISSDYVELTRDSVGHLVVKIDLKALQDADLEEDTVHYLKIVAVLKEITDGCGEKEGTGELYIIGEN